MFKFKLQKALEVKEREEDKIKKELSENLEILKIEENKLESINIEIENTMISYSEIKKGILNISLMNSFEIFLRKLKVDKEKQVNNLISLEEKIQEIKDKFLEIRKEKKIFEKLKEKTYEKYLVEEIKKEQKFIDELSNTMYNRRK